MARDFHVIIERDKEAIALCLEVEGTEPESPDFLGVRRITVP